jgi:hypothetical protein
VSGADVALVLSGGGAKTAGPRPEPRAPGPRRVRQYAEDGSRAARAVLTRARERT